MLQDIVMPATTGRDDGLAALRQNPPPARGLVRHCSVCGAGKDTHFQRARRKNPRGMDGEGQRRDFDRYLNLEFHGLDQTGRA